MKPHCLGHNLHPSFIFPNLQFQYFSTLFPVAYGVVLLSGLKNHVGTVDSAGIEVFLGIDVFAAVVAFADAVSVAGEEG